MHVSEQVVPRTSASAATISCPLVNVNFHLSFFKTHKKTLANNKVDHYPTGFLRMKLSFSAQSSDLTGSKAVISDGSSGDVAPSSSCLRLSACRGAFIMSSFFSSAGSSLLTTTVPRRFFRLQSQAARIPTVATNSGPTTAPAI